MQEQDTSDNTTPPQSVNESEAEDTTTTGNKVGECSSAKNATYRQEKKCSKTTYEESLLEVTKAKSKEMVMMKTDNF